MDLAKGDNIDGVVERGQRDDSDLMEVTDGALLVERMEEGLNSENATASEEDAYDEEGVKSIETNIQKSGSTGTTESPLHDDASESGSSSPQIPNTILQQEIYDDYDTYLKGGQINLSSSRLDSMESMQENEVCDSESEVMSIELKSSSRKSSHTIPNQSSHSVSFGDVNEVHVFPLGSDSDVEDDDEDDREVGEADDSLSSLIGTQRRGSQAIESLRRESSGLNQYGGLLENNRQRISKTIDLETGREGARTQCAVIRDADERYPQMRRRRLQKRAEKAVKNNSFWGRKKKRRNGSHDSDNEEGGDGDDTKERCPNRQENSIVRSHTPSNDDTQYRMKSLDVSMNEDRIFGFSSDFYEQLIAQDDEKGGSCMDLSPNQMVVSYLFWAFRSSFMALFLSAALWFFTLTVSFALVFYGIGMSKSKCIHVEGSSFNAAGGAAFMDAYTLSWTTFSTVGYGLVHPATSSTAYDVRDCFPITVICALESFIGILVASFWSAIFLSKLTRISSFAQVTFSSPILIRYGTGLGTAADDEDEQSHSSSSSSEEFANVQHSPNGKSKPKIHHSELSKIPCPVLEFRIINRLHDQKHGEIIDATMNIAASVDKNQVETTARGNAKQRRYSKRRKCTWNPNSNGLPDEALPTREDWGLAMANVKKMMMENRNLTRRTSTRDMDEDEMDPTASLVSRKVFAKLVIESQEHPFFKRVWLGTHVLDHHSPLLRQAAKQMVQLNNGHWPQILNEPEAIRSCVKFDQILVSMSGTSSADCKSVYAQKVYDYVDLCVGYKFVNILYRDKRGCLNVDEDLLNDVVEQAGGGGENLFQRELDPSTHGQIFIL